LRSPPITIEEVGVELEQAMADVWSDRKQSSRLNLVMIESDAWRLAQTDPHGLALLGQVKCAAALAASLFGCTSESRRMAWQARDLPYYEGPSNVSLTTTGAILSGGTMEQRGLRLLDEDLLRPLKPGLRVNALAECVSSHAAAGNEKAARVRWLELVHLTELYSTEDPYTRDHTYIEMCLLTGRLDDALEVAQRVRLDCWVHQHYGSGLLACAWALAGERDLAQACLDQALRVAAPQNLHESLRSTVESVLKRNLSNSAATNLAVFLPNPSADGRSIF
jgi:hypothetical protein